MRNAFSNFASGEIHVSLPTETILNLGPLPITNTMLLGGVGVFVMFALFVNAVRHVKRGTHSRLSNIVTWAFEGLYNTVFEIVPDRKVAKSIAPLALAIFFTVLCTYWISVLPGVGHSIMWGDGPLLRGLPTDLNFTLAIAIITMVAVQFYAIKAHGIFGNMGRYLMNPFKNPIGAFEGVLELLGEFSRGIALSLRLFGNAFAGEVLLLIVGAMSGYLAGLSLPFFLGFELFIGFIQAYVFYMLTLIFAALAIASHGSHDTPHTSQKAHSISDTPNVAEV